MAVTHTISGTITSSSGGGPVAGMTVKMKFGESSTVVDTDVTDASGNYSLSYSRASESPFENVWADPEALPPHYGDPGVGPSHAFTAPGGSHDDDFVSPFSNNSPTTTQASTPRSFEEDTGQYTGDASMTDADDDTLSVAKVFGASWGTIDSVGVSGTPKVYTIRWTWDTTGVTPGEYEFQYRATDQFGATSTTRSVFVTITAGNSPPVLTNPGNKSYLNKSGNQTFQLSATDPDNDPLVYSKQSGPTWVTVSSSGLVTVATNSATRGVHNVTYKVIDGQGGEDTETHTITINNNPPVLTNPGNQQYSTNSGSHQVQLSSTDVDGDTRTHSKVSGAAWGTVTSGGLITFSVNGIAAGTYPFTFRVSDGQGGTDDESFNVVLVDPVPSPFFQAVG